MRKKTKQHHIPDVRDIFTQQREAQEKSPIDSDLQSIRTNKNKGQGKDDQPSSEAVDNKELIPRTAPEDKPASETDISLEVSFVEQVVRKSSVGKGCRRSEAMISLPSFRLPKDKTSMIRIRELASQYMKKVCYLSLIELTVLYDVLGMELKQQKAVRIKTRDSDLFGIPLIILLEQDQRKVPGIRTLLFFQKLISHIEECGLETEGFLQIPGAAMRIKNLCQELEAKFYEETFNWESIKQQDVTSLLKLLLRELPQSPQSVEYLKSFKAVQNLPTKREQLQALNSFSFFYLTQTETH